MNGMGGMAASLDSHASSSYDDLDPDRPEKNPSDSGLVSKLQSLLAAERSERADVASELQVERAAHDETAEKMVELKHKLEVTLQELANLERFVKRQEQLPAGQSHSPSVEKLLREEAYLKSRLLYVQQELAQVRDATGGGKESARSRKPSIAEMASAGAGSAEERVIDGALSI